MVTIEIVEYSNRRKNQSYSKQSVERIPAIIFRLYFEEVSIFVVWLGRFAHFRQVATLRHGHVARRFAPAFRALEVFEHI